MDQYALLVIESIIRKFENRIELIEHRGFPYMAKGALLSHLEGAPKALSDLAKIMKWAKTRFYISREEFHLVQTMIGRTRERGDEANTKLGRVRGRAAPWQEWPTLKHER